MGPAGLQVTAWGNWEHPLNVAMNWKSIVLPADIRARSAVQLKCDLKEKDELVVVSWDYKPQKHAGPFA